MYIYIYMETSRQWFIPHTTSIHTTDWLSQFVEQVVENTRFLATPNSRFENLLFSSLSRRLNKSNSADLEWIIGETENWTKCTLFYHQNLFCLPTSHTMTYMVLIIILSTLRKKQDYCGVFLSTIAKEPAFSSTIVCKKLQWSSYWRR